MTRTALLALLGLAVTVPTLAEDAPKTRVYVGTYTAPGKSKGIYLLELDPSTGTLTPKGVAAETPSPSFLAVHPSRKFLYAVNEVDKFKGKDAGSVSAFAIDPKTGMLTSLNAQTSGGPGPCYVTVDPTGSAVLAANYGGGSLEVLPVDAEGKLGAPTTFIQHKGSGKIKGRQSSPHAHSIDLDASGKLAVAADLGLDKLMVYRLDPKAGMLTPNVPPYAEVAPGSGPRHFAFHPDGRHAYVINEIACTVTVLDFDASRGAFSELQTISTRKPNAPDNNHSTAEILVHPSGKFVYGSNRGGRHPGDLLGRPRLGQADHRRFPAHRGQDSSELRDRPHGPVRPRRQPGLRHDRGLPDRSPDRSTQAGGRPGQGPLAGLCQVRDGGRMRTRLPRVSYAGLGRPGGHPGVAAVDRG